MQKLAMTIAKELRKEPHCAVYQPELVRVWPKDGGKREKAIMEFAQRHGWRLRFYKDGFCAIFDKWPRRGRRD
jgi:hypothetical protein